MNPVEVLYASFPFFLYLNATYGGQLLKPLLESQQYYDQPYAARDLGTFSSISGDIIIILRFFDRFCLPSSGGIQKSTFTRH